MGWKNAKNKRFILKALNEKAKITNVIMRFLTSY